MIIWLKDANQDARIKRMVYVKNRVDHLNKLLSTNTKLTEHAF
jgi:hypothetical protein